MIYDIWYDIVGIAVTGHLSIYHIFQVQVPFPPGPCCGVDLW